MPELKAELLRMAEAELLEYFGFPSEPKVITDLFARAMWKTLIRLYVDVYLLKRQIGRFKDAIVTDQATGAADYAEAEEYADKIIKAAAAEDDVVNPQNLTSIRLLLDEVADHPIQTELQKAIARWVHAKREQVLREDTKGDLQMEVQRQERSVEDAITEELKAGVRS